jgi:hypothetical protein
LIAVAGLARAEIARAGKMVHDIPATAIHEDLPANLLPVERPICPTWPRPWPTPVPRPDDLWPWPKPQPDDLWPWPKPYPPLPDPRPYPHPWWPNGPCFLEAR